MESLSVKHLITLTRNSFLIGNQCIPNRISRIDTNFRRFRFVLRSKKAASQDFQGYAQPSRLLLATEPEVVTDSSLEKIFTSFKLKGCECLYKVKVQTSSIYGSGLSDLNAGILLCLVDENGDSILQRIPANLIEGYSSQLEKKSVSDGLHFQRGSADEFTFEGPKLGKIEALWISLESGQWRLGGASLTATCRSQPTLDQNGREDVEYIGYNYEFEIEDTLLGEGSHISMVELRPCLITEFSVDNLTSLRKYLLHPTSSTSDKISKEESMREYENLKFSLLLYDALLILIGSSIANLIGENASFAFLTGGMGGFLYLLLLQRSVDGLQDPDRTEELTQMFGRFKGSVTGLVLAVSFSVIAVKFGSGDGAMGLTPKDLMFGLLGFLACKVAVVLAAFKPVLMGLKDKK
ncbi:hypothetical protein U1Q18_032044 [Sarracenia purpurea var. burkii]